MSRRPRCPDTDDLLSWAPPQPVKAFRPERVRAASLRHQISRAVSEALRDCGRPRDQVVAAMSEYLGEAVTQAVLDKYASEAAEEHVINVVRFIGLIHATRDRRLLQLIAELFDWAVIEKRYLPAIELAAVQEQEDEIRRRRETLRRQLKATGAL